MRRLFTIVMLGMVMVGFVFSSVCIAQQELFGAGATFPYPLYSKIFNVYYQKFGVKVNYQPIGSGGGIRQLLNRTVDFGATDAFMSEEEVNTEDNYILHVPTCVGAVAITYNLPGVSQLKFTPGLIVDIFSGKVKKWNNQRIAQVNPEVNLPNMDIMVVHRSDGSGTTFVFSDYLGKVSQEWKKKIGVGKVLDWPTGLGAKGNPGVAGLIKQIPGSVGYVELIYALQNGMPVGIIENKSGNFVEPTVESVSAAAEVDLPEHTRVSVTNTEAKDGYPISSFSWIIFYKEQSYAGRSEERAQALVKLLWWVIHEGQKFCQPLHYAPLPEAAVKKAEDIIRSVVYNEHPIRGM